MEEICQNKAEKKIVLRRLGGNGLEEKRRKIEKKIVCTRNNEKRCKCNCVEIYLVEILTAQNFISFPLPKKNANDQGIRFLLKKIVYDYN